MRFFNWPSANLAIGCTVLCERMQQSFRSGRLFNHCIKSQYFSEDKALTQFCAQCVHLFSLFSRIPRPVSHRARQALGHCTVCVCVCACVCVFVCVRARHTCVFLCHAVCNIMCTYVRIECGVQVSCICVCVCVCVCVCASVFVCVHVCVNLCVGV